MASHTHQNIDIGWMAQQACLLEVTAPKAGNVHPQADFDDMAWIDFVRSAKAIRPAMARATEQSLGQTVLDAVIATQKAVEVNTNLGLILLLAPLCAVPPNETLEQGIARILASTTVDDARLTYQAIRLASPAGLGEVDNADVQTEPRVNLLETMKLAADHDAIAAEYASGFHELLHIITPRFVARLKDNVFIDDAIVTLHLECVTQGDSLIARKFGPTTASDVADRAKAVLDVRNFDSEKSEPLQLFDAWLRDHQPRLNPGTSADMVGAALFIALRNGELKPPFRWRNSLRSEPCGS